MCTQCDEKNHTIHKFGVKHEDVFGVCPEIVGFSDSIFEIFCQIDCFLDL